MPNKLTEQQRIYLVRRLAAFDKPRAIARDFAREFGVTVSPQLVESYHPGRAAGRRLAPRWKQLFAQARAAFLDSTTETGAMHEAVRVHWREGIAHDAWDAGLFKAASDVLDAIAKDIGGAFDNRKKPERFGTRAQPAPATINLYGRPQPKPAPEKPAPEQPAPEKSAPKKPASKKPASKKPAPKETGRGGETHPDAAPAERGTATAKKRG
jgi:hypothetical protein